jgi:hypothetical protein
MTAALPLGHEPFGLELGAERRLRVTGERNLLLSMGMSFFVMPFYGEAMHMRNMGMSFFVVCPLRNCECKAPKIGMNCNQSLTILFPFDSS